MWTNEHGYDLEVNESAARTGVPASLLLAHIGVESGFQPDAINPSDPGSAWGLLQMIPTTARGLGYLGPMDALLTDPGLAIRLGAQLIRDNLRQASGSVADSVSAYNGGFRPSLGFGATRADGTYANQAYVDRVLRAKAYFEGAVGAGESLTPLLLGLLAVLGFLLIQRS